MPNKIPYSTQSINSLDIEAVVSTLKHTKKYDS
jgi:hypothetical protein